MKLARRSIPSIVAIVVTLLAYVVSTTAAVAHIHIHAERGDHPVKLVGFDGVLDFSNDDGNCALCDGGRLLALPGLAPISVDHALLPVEHATALCESPLCADRTVTTLRGPPAR